MPEFPGAPTPTEHPRAERLLRSTRRIICLSGLFGFISLFLMLLTCLTREPIVVLVFVFPFCMSLMVCMACMLIHGFTVLVCFLRVSLGQVLAALLAIGLCISLIVKLDAHLKPIPVFVLLTTFAVILINILKQDPSGDRETPEFIQREMGSRLRERIKRGRETAATQANGFRKQDVSEETKADTAELTS